jgi:hypothetical protein
MLVWIVSLQEAELQIIHVIHCHVDVRGSLRWHSAGSERQETAVSKASTSSPHSADELKRSHNAAQMVEVLCAEVHTKFEQAMTVPGRDMGRIRRF